MTARLLTTAALACCLAAGGALAGQVTPVPAATSAAPDVARPETPSPAPAGAANAGAPAAAARADLAPRPVLPVPGSAVGSSAGNLLQTIFALLVVLGLLAGLAWFLKRYGPKAAHGSANVKMVGALNLGGRERIMVVEVGDQWIVVGASPGRVNALATMPRQHTMEQPTMPQPGLPAASGFSEWLKQTIDKRNAR